MRGAACAALLALALAGCAGAPPAGSLDLPGQLRPIAEPGKVVATELAFARLAREQGQWTAFAEYAAGNGVMFVPQPVNAKDWLKGRENPMQAATWQPREVWSSCDGSLAFSRGAWRHPDSDPGFFLTLWQRQVDGEYRWTLNDSDYLAEPLTEPEMIGTKTAKCGELPPPSAQPSGPPHLGGESNDGTLRWTAETDSDCRRTITVSLWQGKTRGMDKVRYEIAAPGEGNGTQSANCPPV